MPFRSIVQKSQTFRSDTANLFYKAAKKKLKTRERVQERAGKKNNISKFCRLPNRQTKRANIKKRYSVDKPFSELSKKRSKAKQKTRVRIREIADKKIGKSKTRRVNDELGREVPALRPFPERISIKTNKKLINSFKKSSERLISRNDNNTAAQNERHVSSTKHIGRREDKSTAKVEEQELANEIIPVLNKYSREANGLRPFSERIMKKRGDIHRRTLKHCNEKLVARIHLTRSKAKLMVLVKEQELSKENSPVKMISSRAKNGLRPFAKRIKNIIEDTKRRAVEHCSKNRESKPKQN